MASLCRGAERPRAALSPADYARWLTQEDALIKSGARLAWCLQMFSA